MTTWIERTARQKSIGQVVLFLVVTAIVVWICAENRAYLKVFFKGPPPATAADLDMAEHEVNGEELIATPYVTITGDKVLNTGVQEVTTTDGFIKNVSAGYYALEVGDRILIVKSGKTPSTTVGGELGLMPFDLKSDLFPPGTDPAEEAVGVSAPAGCELPRIGICGSLLGAAGGGALRILCLAVVAAALGAGRASGRNPRQGMGRPGGDFSRGRAGARDGGENQAWRLDSDAKLRREERAVELRPVPDGQPGVGVQEGRSSAA